MKWLYVLLLMSFVSTWIIADESKVESGIPGFSSYKPIYGVVGWGNRIDISSNDLVLVNVSFKYDPFFAVKSGIYLAYTQTMFWAFFDESGPFRELNYRPEAFFRFESGYNFINDVSIPGFDFVQLGWEHRSNGKAGEISRGWDRVYAQLQLGIGDTPHFSLGAKYFRYLEGFELYGHTISAAIRDNPDIENYTSNFEFLAALNFDIPLFPFKAVLTVGPGGGRHGFDFLMGWQQLDVYFLKFAGSLRPYLQIWHGYGQSIEDYNRSDLNAHAGIALEL